MVSYKSNKGFTQLLPLLVLAILAIGVLFALQAVRKQTTFKSHAAGTSPCQFQKADPGYQIAFCDTFDQPTGTGNRSGDLNGIVWGVSRLTDGFNAGQGQYDYWYPNTLDKCGTLETVNASNDIQICNGQLVETTGNDGGEGGEVAVAMYPKQPFDIAGRTGTVTFDVTADSQGPHAAWPTFFYTDQPIPAPLSDMPPNTEGSTARNSFGFALDAYGNTADNQFIDNCPNTNDTSVGEMFVSRNYVLSHIPFTVVGCVARPSVAGATADNTHLGTGLNHFEVRLSQNHVEIWGTDPGSTTMKELAYADNVNMPLTRGLIWIEDVRYNADKFNKQAMHTFAWDNVGFDGPTLPRDLANDVLNASNGNNDNLGWGMFPTGTLQVPGVSNVSQAAGALLTMNWFPNNNTAGSFKYRLNGNAWQTATWPYGQNVPWSPHTLGVPVPLADVVNGTNKIDFDFSGVTGAMVANVDLIMVGAGGIPTCLDPSNCADATSNPTVAPTVSPSPTSSLAPTPSPTTVIGDLNGDGHVTIIDVSILLSNWMTNNAIADLNHDGIVNITDISILLSHFGT